MANLFIIKEFARWDYWRLKCQTTLKFSFRNGLHRHGIDLGSRYCAAVGFSTGANAAFPIFRTAPDRDRTPIIQDRAATNQDHAAAKQDRTATYRDRTTAKRDSLW